MQTNKHLEDELNQLIKRTEQMELENQETEHKLQEQTDLFRDSNNEMEEMRNDNYNLRN